ncbi:MAG: DedA family protein [Chloroflexaceae bacterium]|jgi:membrane protein DedA with SNARE-associated domain|nr:DedA family protein [Chloroflexaceae bacterium]
MSDILKQLSIWIETIITSLHYPGITLVMFIENLFPPIPSELVMPYAGFLVAQGEFSFIGIVLAGTLGSVMGAVVLYYIGVWADEHIVRNFIRRFGRWFMISEEDLDKALAYFDRHGEAVVFFGRLIPLVRSLISIPAGMDRMPMSKFLLFTTLGSAIWTSLLGGAGWWLGANWEAVLGFLSQYQRGTLVVLVLGVIGFFAFRFMQSRSQKARATASGRVLKDAE